MGKTQNALHAFAQLILLTTLWDRYYYYNLSLKDVKFKAQRGEAIGSWLHSLQVDMAALLR